jgi:hypothetical protein
MTYQFAKIIDAFALDLSVKIQECIPMIANVSFLVLATPITLMLVKWQFASTRGMSMFPIRDDLDANVAGYVLLT